MSNIFFLGEVLILGSVHKSFCGSSSSDEESDASYLGFGLHKCNEQYGNEEKQKDI